MEADGAELSLGSRLAVRVDRRARRPVARRRLRVEVVYGRAGDDDEIVDPVLRDADRRRGRFRRRAAHFSGSVELGRPGPFGYTVRLVPKHPLLASRAELGLVTYPDAPAGMTNGDLR